MYSKLKKIMKGNMKRLAVLFVAVGFICSITGSALACPGQEAGDATKPKCGAMHAEHNAEAKHGCPHKKEGSGCSAHGKEEGSCKGSCGAKGGQVSECGCAKSESCACAGCSGCNHAKKQEVHSGCGMKEKKEPCSCGADKPKELKVAPGGKCVDDVDCCCWGGECLGGKECCKKLSCKK